MKPFITILAFSWLAPGAVLAVVAGEKAMEQLIINSPFAATYIIITVAFLKHIDSMNKARGQHEDRLIKTLEENAKTMSRMKDSIGRLEEFLKRKP